MPSPTAWIVAHLVLDGLLVTPLSVIWFVSFCTVRNKGDPARRAFTWMKVVFPLLAAALVFYTVTYAINVVLLNIDYYYYYDQYTLEEIESRVFDVGLLVENLAHIFLLVCLVDLGMSFLYIWNRNKKSQNIALGLTFGLGVVLFALAIARYGRSQALRTDTYNALRDDSYSSTSYDWNSWYQLRELMSAFDIILWVAAIGITGFAIYILVISRQKPELKQCAVLYLVVSILYLLRNTWELAYDAKWMLPKNSNVFVPDYVYILDPILDMWVTFILLVIIFAMGCKKRDGFWTVQQPYEASYGGPVPQQAWPAPMYPVAAQGYAPYPLQTVPAQWQQKPGYQQPGFYPPPVDVNQQRVSSPGEFVHPQHNLVGATTEVK